MPDPEIIHLYAQPHEHATAYIVGNPDGLEALKNAIEEALSNPSGVATALLSATDGEGYEVVVHRHIGRWSMPGADPFWARLALPYSKGVDPRPERIYPWDLETPS